MASLFSRSQTFLVNFVSLKLGFAKDISIYLQFIYQICFLAILPPSLTNCFPSIKPTRRAWHNNQNIHTFSCVHSGRWNVELWKVRMWVYPWFGNGFIRFIVCYDWVEIQCITSDMCCKVVDCKFGSFSWEVEHS